MRTHGVILAVVAGLAFNAAVASSQESASYLGDKLEDVLQNVDSAYIEKCKPDLGTRHRKAFQKLGDHLEKRYPALRADLFQWLQQHYGVNMEEIKATSDERYILLDTFLSLDREHQEFRQGCVSHLKSKYPSLFGDIACFLRDNHIEALREVLHATLRMTSHVPSCPISGETEAKAVPQGKELKTEGEISMVP